METVLFQTVCNEKKLAAIAVFFYLKMLEEFKKRRNLNGNVNIIVAVAMCVDDGIT